MDDQCGSDTKQLLKNAEQWEAKYLSALPKPGKSAVALSLSLSLIHVISTIM